MRGEASRISDRVSRDELAPKLRSTGKDAWRIGNELFTITNVLDHTVQLERALTDPSRPVDDKIGVLKELIGAQAHPMTLGIMSDLVGRKWSRAAHIANAVEDFGVDAMMYYADATGVTLRVSVELAELHSALLNLPVLRSKLNDDSVPAKARIDLLNGVQPAQPALSGDHPVADQQVLAPHGRVDDYRDHRVAAEHRPDQATDRRIFREARPSGAHQLGCRPHGPRRHAHPGRRRGHGQHRGRPATAAATHGKGESLTIRFRAAPHAATEPDLKFSNNKE